MRLKLLALLFLLPLLASASCGGETAKYVTTTEFAEYQQERREADQRLWVFTSRQIQHHKWLTKVEIEACGALNKMLRSNNSGAHCLEVLVSGEKGPEGHPAVAVLMTDEGLRRCPVLLTWDRMGKLHIFPKHPPEGSELDYWQDVL